MDDSDRTGDPDERRAAAKRAAGRSAVEAVTDGDVVGLGTGSTAAAAIAALGERVDAGLDVTGVPTSYQSRRRAIDAGIPIADLDQVDVDVAVDGADQVAGADLVKGGGAAHAREKVVDLDADRFLVVVDPSKTAPTLTASVPVEVFPWARRPVADAVRARGADPSLRAATEKDGPVVTDNGNHVLDCAFGAIEAPAGLADWLATTPGVVAHGLFPDAADEVHVGTPEGVTVHDH